MNKEEKLKAIEEIKEDSKVLEFVAITMQEKENLQSNWNSLREFVTLKEKPKVFSAKNGKTLELAMEFVFDMVLDKMNELEGINNEK